MDKVQCEECFKWFQIVWNCADHKYNTLRIFYCESGGIYAVEIKCVHCGHVVELE